MNKSDTAMLLAKIAAYDRRTVGEADVEAWCEALEGQVTLQDAMTAVRDHYRTSTDFLMPVGVITQAREIRRRRVRDAGVPDIPGDLSAAEERKWLRAFWDALNDNDYRQTTREDAYLAANQALGIKQVPAKVVPAAQVRELIAKFAAEHSIIPTSGIGRLLADTSRELGQ